MTNESTFLYCLNIYKKEWGKIVFLVVIAMLVTGVVEYIKPTVYKSTVMVLSDKQGGSPAINLGGVLGLSNISIADSSDEIIFSMLKSKRMRTDINEHFNLKNKASFQWSLDTYKDIGGFAIELKASDPEMAKNIANFAVENLDKINLELQITLNKPMIKVLDPAVRGVPESKGIARKMFITGLFLFLIYSFYIFALDYVKKNMKGAN